MQPPLAVRGHSGSRWQQGITAWRLSHLWSVGGLEHFSPIDGIMIQSDFHIFQRGRSTGFSTFFNPEESSQMLVHDVSPELTHPRFLPLRKSQWKCTISLFRRFSNRVPLDQQAMSTRVKIQLGQRPIEAKRVAIGKGNECVGWIKQQGGLLWIPAKH